MGRHWLPTDLRQVLLTFVPAPAAFALPTVPEPPATLQQTRNTWTGQQSVKETVDVPVRVRATAWEAEHDLRAVLRLIEAGRVRVSDKKRQPTAASQKAIAGVLQGGDFYTVEDEAESAPDPSADLTIKAFAWPMIVQAAGLAQKTGDNLKLTPAGTKALAAPAAEVIRDAYGVLDDFQDCWGAEDLSCLSRYDGLLYACLNPLGAWGLGQAKQYETPPAPVIDVLQVLPNLDIVVTHPPLSAADRLILDRFAEPQSEGSWKLTAAKVLAVLEQGGTLDELEEFLKTRGAAVLPHTAEVFLRDQRERAGRLRDLGTARVIECADAALAQMLAADSQLRGKCQVAGERWLVFQAGDETAVRRGLRRLGYILPGPG